MSIEVRYPTNNGVGVRERPEQASRGLVWGGLLVIGLVLVMTPNVGAQTPGSVVGLVGGRVVNEQVWASGYETEPVRGVQLGGFLNAATPVPWFRMRAEFMWTQRGGSVAGGPGGELLSGETRTDYLTVGIQPRLAARRGRVEIFAVAGPMIELVVRHRIGAELSDVLQEVPSVYGVGAGVGIAARIGSSVHAEVEARLFEGLGDAYEGDFLSAKNRSFGLVARIGRPMSR